MLFPQKNRKDGRKKLPSAAKGAKSFAKTEICVYHSSTMSLMKRIKLSRFVLSCIFLTGYAAYTVYAVYYYTRYEDSRIGTILLCLIGAALALSVVITIVSYRINMMDKPRPKLHRFIKMAKYTFQLIASAITIFLVISTVQNTNVFSIIMSFVSVSFLLWSLFVNVLAELFDHTFRGFGKKVYEPQELCNEEGERVDVRAVISNVDGAQNTRRQMSKKKKPSARAERQ